jgi:hypothetical protein
LDEFASRAEIEMKGIGKDKFNRVNFCSNVLWVAEQVKDKSFDGCFRSNRHKNGSLKSHSVQGEFAHAGISALFEDFEVEF